MFSLSETVVLPLTTIAVPQSDEFGERYYVQKLDICGDLLALAWWPHVRGTHYFQLWNWKTGNIIWVRLSVSGINEGDWVNNLQERTCKIRTEFCTQFAFLDHHHIVVASDNGTELRVYTIHPDRPPSIVHSNPASLDDTSTRIFLLPPVKDGISIQIDELSSQRAPSSRPGCAAAFEHNTQLTTLAITFIVSSGNIGYRYMLVVPTSALLCAYTCNTGSQPHTDENRGAVPWEAWGAPCSRSFRFDTRGHGRWGVSMCAMSSRCLFINHRWSQHNRLTILDILVVELRPWARQYGAVDVETDPLAEYLNRLDTLLAPEELEPRESIHKRLMFRVVRRMVVAYGGEVDSSKYNSFLALLPDGVALIVSVLFTGASSVDVNPDVAWLAHRTTRTRRTPRACCICSLPDSRFASFMFSPGRSLPHIL